MDETINAELVEATMRLLDEVEATHGARGEINRVVICAESSNSDTDEIFYHMFTASKQTLWQTLGLLEAGKLQVERAWHDDTEANEE